jgi:hypothetical protein
MVDEVDEEVRVEIRDADGADLALLVQGLRGPPLAVDVTEGLVNQVQVEVVQAEPGELLLERAPGVVLGGGVLDPQLGSDEHVLARDGAGGDGPSDRVLVLVGGGVVEVAVAEGERIVDRSLGVLGGI